MKSSLRACEFKPPGQGGIQILAAVTVADVAVVDVSVIMQHKFQQSLFMNPWCLIQFINRVVVFQLPHRDRYAQPLLCRRRGDSTVAVVPVLWNDNFGYRQCRILWNCRRCGSCGFVGVAVIIQRLFQQSKSYGSRAISVLSTECRT